MEATSAVLGVQAQESGQLLSIICISLHLSRLHGPLKWQNKNGHIMIIIPALTFSQIYIPALTLGRCVNLNKLLWFLQPNV